MTSTLRQPSALIPVLMSLSALAIVLGHIVFTDTAREADEGAAAHLWQLLMAGQLPFLGYFILTAVLRAPRQALPVLALQAALMLAAMAPVFAFNL
jgi:hypothetical protein